MKQYFGIKAKYPDAVLLFRVGDFYETFDEDARIASKVLGIVLTKRANGAANEVDLAGFPHHSLDVYLPKLVRAGYRVAICDQLEDPKLTKTIVKRGVTELVTPGVNYNDKVLESRQSNFLASVYFNGNKAGIALLDISTGEFFASEGDIEYIKKIAHGFKPAEFVCARSQYALLTETFGTQTCNQTLDEWIFDVNYATEKLLKQFKALSLKGFGISELELAIVAAGAALQYLDYTHHTQTGHITGISRMDEEKYVWLDGFTVRNLELLQPIFPGGTSLLSILDKTSTPMGARLLHNWLVLPLKDLEPIVERQNAVEFFYRETPMLETCVEHCKQIGDLQRLTGRIALMRLSPREALQLARSLTAVAALKSTLQSCGNASIEKLAGMMNDNQAIIQRIGAEISDEAPAVAGKGQIFKAGVNAELDELRTISTSGKDYLLEIQKREQERTQIPSLKIGFNNVFGYFLEVTHTHKSKVPDEWIRKQTLTNAERYITPELKEYEDKILHAEERIGSLENQLWEDLQQWLQDFVPVVQLNANLVAQLDCLMGFAQLASENNYVKPELNNGYGLILKDCRHPVIEKQLPPEESYIPNDINLDNEASKMMILTGPNMSGKSAILRQTALAVIMAQMGSFVPCSQASIGLVDKIYTRVGASDNISLGESTFMVEMLETASILNNISNRSLILLDEIGRGTSTYDGVSLAWSIAEYLQSHPGNPKTLFATHYHELNELESKLTGIINYHVSVLETATKIVFLRKLKPGGSEHSFGIHVAQMAGIPNKVLMRANEILQNLENDRSHISGRETLKKTKAKPVYQLNMFQTEDPMLAQVKEALKKVDINNLSPVEALLKLQDIKQKCGL